MENSIPVFMTSDNYYAPFIATTIVSIMENTRAYVDFYIVDCGISETFRGKLLDLGKKYTCKIGFIQIETEELFTGQIETNHISRAMYGKYLLPEYLHHIDRAIYTDLDVVFVGDIESLWKEELGEYVIGAVPSQRGKINNNYEKYKLMYDLDRGHEVFMSGLFLINCMQWRNEKITEQLIDISKKNRVADQEAFNILFQKNKYYRLDSKYCVIYKITDCCYDIDEKKDLLNRQLIIHYPGGGESKPWNNPRLYGSRFFWAVAVKTNFYNEILERIWIETDEKLAMKAKKYKSVMIYGAGELGKLTAKCLLEKYGINITAFIVSKKQEDDYLYEIPVLEAAEVLIDDNTLVIAAVGVKWLKEIRYNIEKIGFPHVVYMNWKLEENLRSKAVLYHEVYGKLEGRINELQRQIDGMHILLNHVADISQCTMSTGELRRIQEADILLLQIFHIICCRENISYWLDYGTLLGAVRHKGFIPWDDDIDVAMVRDDYDKMRNALKYYLEPWGFIINEGRGFVCQIIRITYPGYPAQIDIWPYDYSNLDISDPELREKLSEKIRVCNDVFVSRYVTGYKKGEIRDFPQDKIRELYQKVIGDCDKAHSRAIFGGIEAIPYGTPNIFLVSEVFPLKEIKWEGINTYAPCLAEQYLTGIYGDYMGFPKLRIEGHSNIISKGDYCFEEEMGLLKKVRSCLEEMPMKG